MKKLVPIFIALCLCLSSIALLSSCSSGPEEFIVVDGHSYRLNDDGQTYTFWGVDPNYTEDTLTIPASITEKNYKVTAVFGASFQDKSVKKIYLPEGIVTISGFQNCTSLESISGIGKDEYKLPDSVTTIEPNAFEGCTSLKAIKFSKNLTNVGMFAFWNCSALESVELSALTVISMSMFEGCVNLTDIRIPDTVTKIEENAFGECEKLESITIPGSVQIIGQNAFVKCKALKNVKLSEGLQTICDSAFSNCTALKEITIPSSVQKIKSGALQQSELTDITYNGTKDQWATISEETVRGYTVHCSDGDIEG